VDTPLAPLPPRGFVLLLTPPQATGQILAGLLAPLALRGPVRVVDGGNAFPAYTLARLLRARTLNPGTALARIALARAFTCHQMTALLAALGSDPIPTLIPGLLTTFHDDSAPLRERRLLLAQAVAHLRRLGRRAPLLVLETQPPDERTSTLMQMVQRAADRVTAITPPGGALPHPTLCL